MKFKILAACMASVLSLAGCGGGGDAGVSVFSGPGAGGGGSTVKAASIRLTLIDGAGNEINPPVVTGTSAFSVKAVVLDSAGSPVASKKVTLAADDLVLNPVSGQTLTQTNGVAIFGAKPANALVTTATSICASATADTESVTQCLDIQLGASSASLGTMTVSPSTVAAYQTAQVSVPVLIAGSLTPAVGAPVSFSASCGSISPSTATSDSTGAAKAAYTNDNSGASCSGNVTITASTQGRSTTFILVAQAPAPANIQFVQSLPARIYLRGSPSVSTSLVSFKLLDSNGNPILGKPITLDLILKPAGAYLGSTPGTTSVPATTDSTGTVTVSVNAGTAPGPVQVRATYTDTTTTLTNVSNSLAIASGLPTQDSFSLSVSTLNMEAAQIDGVTTTLTVRAADRLGNPVPDGTTVNFIAEGGQIVGSCQTTGASTNSTAACSVVLSSQNIRPANMRVTVLAWAQGEESFVDNSVPNDNVFNGADTFTDLGQPFLDKNYNGVKDAGDDSVGLASGTLSCGTPGIGYTIVPNTCDHVWGTALVSKSVEIVFSDSTFDPTRLNGLLTTSSGRCLYSFTLKDVFGNPLPAGTKLAISNVTGGKTGGDASGDGFGGQGDTVPNTNRITDTNHIAFFKDCSNASTLSFKLDVTVPSGKITSIRYPAP